MYPTKLNLPGDIDCDKQVDLRDALLSLKAMTGTRPEQDSIYSCPGEDGVSDMGGDVNNDGQIGMEEVIYVLRLLANNTE